MEQAAVTVYLTGNRESATTGEVVGPFLIHRPVARSWTNGKAWHVTHIKSGLRFPWQFGRKEVARRFARRVRKLTDWDSVGAKMPSDPTINVASFTTNLPTPEQKKAIRELAATMTEVA